MNNNLKFEMQKRKKRKKSKEKKASRRWKIPDETNKDGQYLKNWKRGNGGTGSTASLAGEPQSSSSLDIPERGMLANKIKITIYIF